MRVARIKEKKLEKTELTAKLIHFFKKLDKEIKDELQHTQIESGDLIQANFIYGGLIEEGGDRYIFTYFPRVGTKNKWELELTKLQIERIAKGNIKTIDLWACQQDGCGSKFMDKNGTCFYHDYHDDGRPDPRKKSKEEIDEIVAQKKLLLEKMIDQME